MKNLFFLALMLFFSASSVLGKEVAKHKAPDGKKIAIENTDGIVVVNGKEKTTIHNINPRFDAYHLVEWTPKGNAVVFLVSKINPKETKGMDCEEEICPDRMYLYLHQLGSKGKKGKTILLEEMYQDRTPVSFGGIIAISFRPKGTDTLKEVCQYKDKKCTPRISFGDKSFSYSLNLYYFADEEEEDAYSKYVTEKVSGDKNVDECYTYYKSVTITRDYSGKLLKKGKPFFAKDLVCGRSGY